MIGREVKKGLSEFLHLSAGYVSTFTLQNLTKLYTYVNFICKFCFSGKFKKSASDSHVQPGLRTTGLDCKWLMSSHLGIFKLFDEYLGPKQMGGEGQALCTGVCVSPSTFLSTLGEPPFLKQFVSNWVERFVYVVSFEPLSSPLV